MTEYERESVALLKEIRDYQKRTKDYAKASYFLGANKMSVQLDALTKAVADQTTATNALTAAVAGIPAQTPPENLQPAIDGVTGNTVAVAAAVTALQALAGAPAAPAPAAPATT